ncbi:hypothetical protein ACFVAF_25425 [Streptomyces sp. NPDC057596]|uniref:hypothetical protein n=1 Tax=Streptomyces sp. NPDC057596 TaxID=3346178 RepID=UPI0036A378B5
MPAGIHLKTARTFRPDSPELYERAKDAVAEVDSTINQHINAFLRWLTHETDELPARPPAKRSSKPE